ncbi:hypothetical protein Hanom_Chr09g00775811 [Helianthus anomalus]
MEEVWVEEESSHWVPDSVGPVDVPEAIQPGIRPGSESEEVPSEEEDGSAGNLKAGENHDFDFRDINKVVGEVSVSKAVGSPHSTGGAQDMVNEECSGNNDVYFFKSLEAGSPIKGGVW